MTPADLLAWREHMGYSHRQAAAAFGIAPNTYQQMERGASWKTGKPIQIDRRTALACAALAAGLGEWAPEVVNPRSARTCQST